MFHILASSLVISLFNSEFRNKIPLIMHNPSGTCMFPSSLISACYLFNRQRNTKRGPRIVLDPLLSPFEIFNLRYDSTDTIEPAC